MAMLERRADRLWIYEEPLRFLGFEIGRIMTVIRNEATVRRSIQDVLAWEFDRVIPGHGEVIEGFDWLLSRLTRP